MTDHNVYYVDKHWWKEEREPSDKPLLIRKKRPKAVIDIPIFLTVKEAADRLNVSRCTIYHLISTGLLESQPIGKRGIRISVESLGRFLDEAKTNFRKR